MLFTPDLADERVGDVLTDAEAISRRQVNKYRRLGFGFRLLYTSIAPVGRLTAPPLRGFSDWSVQIRGCHCSVVCCEIAAFVPSCDGDDMQL